MAHDLLAVGDRLRDAAVPEITRFDDSFVFTSHLCAFPIHVTTRLTGTQTQMFDRRGHVIRTPLRKDVYAIWTNRLSGRSVIERDHLFAVVYPDLSAWDIGLNYHLSLPSGRVILVDAGRLVGDPDPEHRLRGRQASHRGWRRCAVFGAAVSRIRRSLDPKARDDLRRVLIPDQADHDWIASHDARRREALIDHQATVSAAPSTLHRVGWSEVSCLPIKGLRLARPPFPTEPLPR